MICYPFAVDNVMTRVFEAGTGDKVVVLQHGLTSRADRWRQTVAALAAQGYHVYAADLPGHGFASKDSSCDQSISGYRDFLLRFLDKIGAKRAHLVGTSLGGHVVAAAAISQPERIETLTMIGSLGLLPIPAERIATVRSWLSDMSASAMRERLLRVFTDPRHVTDDLVQEDVMVNTSPGAVASLERFLDYMQARFNDELVLQDLVSLGGRFPLLLLWGEMDQSVPVSVAHAARQALPHARLVTLAAVNHTPYIERPDLFEPVLLDFMSGQHGRFVADGVAYF